MKLSNLDESNALMWMKWKFYPKYELLSKHVASLKYVVLPNLHLGQTLPPKNKNKK